MEQINWAAAHFGNRISVSTSPTKVAVSPANFAAVRSGPDWSRSFCSDVEHRRREKKDGLAKAVADLAGLTQALYDQDDWLEVKRISTSERANAVNLTQRWKIRAHDLPATFAEHVAEFNDGEVRHSVGHRPRFVLQSGCLIFDDRWATCSTGMRAVFVHLHRSSGSGPIDSLLADRGFPACSVAVQGEYECTIWYRLAKRVTLPLFLSLQQQLFWAVNGYEADGSLVDLPLQLPSSFPGSMTAQVVLPASQVVYTVDQLAESFGIKAGEAIL